MLKLQKGEIWWSTCFWVGGANLGLVAFQTQTQNRSVLATQLVDHNVKLVDQKVKPSKSRFVLEFQRKIRLITNLDGT